MAAYDPSETLARSASGWWPQAVTSLDLGDNEMTWRFALGIAALLAWTGVAQAQPKSAPAGSIEYSRCVASSGQRDAAVAECERTEFRRQDQVLNTVYKQLEGKLDASGKSKLRDAQRAWIAFRDSQCAYERAREEGGTLAPRLEASCLKRLTGVRVQDLRQMLGAEQF
jgi:uncharacterized protein YecT (DUF1311 family)